MAELNLIEYDRTLIEIDKAIIEKAKLRKPSSHIGMSGIGEECWRKLFYQYRLTENKSTNVVGIKAAEDGYAQESVMAARLRMLPYIELITNDPDNPEQQIGFSLLLGHLKGYCDGIIKGLVERPSTYCVWEHKSKKETDYNKLIKLRNELGEKQTLQQWNPSYYAQAQLYMHEAHLERHYMTVSLPGGRGYISICTEYNKKIAESLIEKARVIIFDNWTIPARLANSRESFTCKYCDYKEQCFDTKLPLVNCKTCRYCKPVNDGKFECLNKDKEINNEIIFIGCNDHIYNPALLDVKLVEHQKEACIYHIEDKNIYFANASKTSMPDLGKDKEPLDFILTSKELRDNIKYLNRITKEDTKLKEQPKGKAWDKRLKSI
jgi:hypothetical protein